MISGTNNMSGTIRQKQTIANTAPGRLLSRVCMLTMVLQYAVTITFRSTGCDHTTIQAAANAAKEDE